MAKSQLQELADELRKLTVKRERVVLEDDELVSDQKKLAEAVHANDLALLQTGAALLCLDAQIRSVKDRMTEILDAG